MRREVTVVPEAGLHARPAAKFVEAASEYDIEITVKKQGSDEDPVDAHSMLAVTSLGAHEGDVVVIAAEGDGAAQVLDRLEEILSTPEGDTG